MLSSNVPATPRPRPPAKARRTTSMHFAKLAPPPPYAPPLEVKLLDSQIAAAAQTVGPASGDGLRLPPTPSVEDWMNEKSREELSGLLLKADGLIKSRETELSLTSALCKSLYNDNVTLKNKHEALLARLPSTRAPSPSPSVPSSPMFASTPVSQSPSHHGSNIPPLASARMRHSRRISVTPSELASLADQNAELLDKLEKLEAESVKADHAGKRKLRKLEKEIQGLREELENTQAKGAALEEQAKGSGNLSAEEVQRRKEEREERLRALKEKSASLDISAEEIRDFAPPSELPRLNIRTAMFDDLEADGSAPGVDDTTSAPADVSTEEEDDSDEQDSYSVPPGMSRVPSQPELEYAIISQLIAKIRELEETNAQITEEQKATEDRLRSVHWDAESIRRVYECLSDGTQVELQMVPEDLPGPSTTNQDPSGGTIRFSSLRRTIDGDISRLLLSDESEGFAGGITRDMQSTVLSVISQHKSGTYHKTRKTVVGLFDEDPESDPEPEAPVSGGWGEYPASLNVASSFRVRPASPFVGDTSTWSHAATDGVTPVSPTLHNLQTPAEGLGMGRTLGSELGSEFGEDWGQNAGNHHLRTSSLYDLAGLNASREMSVSPLPSPVEMRSFVFPTAEDSFDADEEGPSTPPHLPALHLTVQPPTPSPEKISTRTQRLSQTVRARTNRWVEGRFSPASGTRSALRQRRSAATMGRHASAAADASGVLDETFDDVVLQLKRARSRGSLAALVYAGEDDEAERSAVELHAMSRAETSAVTSERKEGFVGFVLEVWLWLQFVIVVLVFLWAMAKRGPKSVLEEAERRKVAQGH